MGGVHNYAPGAPLTGRVNRVNRVNPRFSVLRLPDWRGPNYPRSFYPAEGTQILSGESALAVRTDIDDGGRDVR
jgi:hypothetical protein